VAETTTLDDMTIVFMEEDIEDPCESLMGCSLVAIWDVHTSCGCAAIALCTPCRDETDNTIKRSSNARLIMCLRCNRMNVTAIYTPHKRK
jgi:hypothetical protein